MATIPSYGLPINVNSIKIHIGVNIVVIRISKLAAFEISLRLESIDKKAINFDNIGVEINSLLPIFVGNTLFDSNSFQPLFFFISIAVPK